MRTLLLIFLSLALSLLTHGGGVVAHAQFSMPGNETFLTLNPETPQAGQSFSARVEAYAYDINRSSIRWEIDGQARTEFSGEQQISLTAPALGTPLSIQAFVTEQSGVVHTASKVVAPGTADIIIESDTKVPSFYRGRALPSAGSTVRLIAFPTLFTSAGAQVPTSDLIYTWKANGKVAKSGRAAQTLTTTVPRTGSLTIELTVETLSGDARHTTYERINPSQGTVIFYEDNPLYGMSRSAIPSQLTLLNEEMTIQAEPYFVAKNIFDNAQYEWTMDGASIGTDALNPQSLTLRRTGIAGSSEISFSVRNLQSLLQDAVGKFTIYFQ